MAFLCVFVSLIRTKGVTETEKAVHRKELFVCVCVRGGVLIITLCAYLLRAVTFQSQSRDHVQLHLQ